MKARAFAWAQLKARDWDRSREGEQEDAPVDLMLSRSRAPLPTVNMTVPMNSERSAMKSAPKPSVFAFAGYAVGYPQRLQYDLS